MRIFACQMVQDSGHRMPQADAETTSLALAATAAQALTEAVEEGFLDGDEIRLHEHHRLLVDGGQEPLRMDVFLANRLKNISRSRIKNAALAGLVSVNDKPEQKVSYKVRPLDEISIALPYPPAPALEPENIPLDVVYEDGHLLVINKPAGMVCHPGVGNYDGTLVNALLYHLQQQKEAGLVGEETRPGLVHRIDKDTSGLLVVAKSELAYHHLARQFFTHTTDRLYYAVVWGNVAADKGTIRGNIARSPLDRKRFVVTDDPSEGKHAVTHYTVLQRFGFATLVQCKLETGRTHQIRVHFKHMGHTLFSDTFYGGHRMLHARPSGVYHRFIQTALAQLPRQALHAKTLGFTHPETEQRMFFNSTLPPDIAGLLVLMAQFTKQDPIPELQERST